MNKTRKHRGGQCPCSKVMAGKFGSIALAWHNKLQNRVEMRCAKIGCGDGSDGKLKACVWYVLDAYGKFIEQENAK